MSAELLSIRKYRKENEWGTKKVAERERGTEREREAVV